jgi:hypothetical protein
VTRPRRGSCWHNTLIVVAAHCSLLNAATLSAAAAPRQDDELALVLVSAEAAARGARCLDGSVPGYWFRRGSAANASKWVIHLQGGGWYVQTVHLRIYCCA